MFYASRRPLSPHILWDRTKRDKPSKPFSPEVANAAKQGFISFWRTFDPGVEMSRKGTVPNGARIGFIGLAIEAKENPEWPSTVSQRDVEIATNYALLELNGFPDWAPNLWIENREIAEQLLRREIQWQFAQSETSGNVHHVVSTFAYCSEPFRHLAAEWTLSELETTEPKSGITLSQAIKTITGARTVFTVRLADLAASRFKAARRTDRKLTWLSVWLGTSASSAMDGLEAWIAGIRNKVKRDDLVIKLLNAMFDHTTYRLGPTYQDFRRFEPLKRLVRMAYRHVRIADDVHHDGSYSPDARDGAELARGSLLGMLAGTPGEATYRELVEMSMEPLFADSQEHLQVLADRRATEDANLPPWAPAEVVAFASRHETPPRTLSELHEIVLDRLEDIEDDIIAGRFSNKDMLRQDSRKRADERRIQLAIANELDLRKDDVYSIEREPEQADHNEPDISIQRAGIPQALPIEIKVADSWSYMELKNTISDQLIGKYMKPRGATHGLLVLTYHGKKKSWRTGCGRTLQSFSDLLAALQGEADSLASVDPQVDQISVFGIDLT